jgi:hypothetical protein
MLSFKRYLSEGAKDYPFVIKFAIKPSDDQVAIIETWLKRFDLKSFSPVKIVEHDTQDFIAVPNRTVYSTNIVLGCPISQYILLQDLKTAANISEDLMVVRSANEPIEVYAEQDVWTRTENDKAKAQGKVSGPRLSTDREYTKAEQTPAVPLYGNEYNKKLLSYLAGVEESRPSMEVEPSAPLFSFIKMKEDISPGEPQQDTSDFNAHIDTPKPTSKGSKKDPIKQEFVGLQDQTSDNAIPDVKFYKKAKTGKLSQVVKPVKKGY